MAMRSLSILLFLFLGHLLVFYCQESAKYLTVPTHEIYQHVSHLSVNEHDEMVVTFAGKGSDIRPNDFLTHADGVRILTGGLKAFLDSGEREVIVPIVDDSDVKFGGSKLVGFVMLQAVTPRKLSYRRGDIVYDMEEGGPEPELTVGNLIIGKGGVQIMDSSDFVPVPIGGGPCITGRDCFNYNGTCAGSKGCKCLPDMQGSYCQLYRPSGIGGIQSKAKKREFKYDPSRDAFNTKKGPEIKIVPPKPPPEQDTYVRIGRDDKGAEYTAPAPRTAQRTTTSPPPDTQQRTDPAHATSAPPVVAAEAPAEGGERRRMQKKGPRKRKPSPQQRQAESDTSAPLSPPREEINTQPSAPPVPVEEPPRQQQTPPHRDAAASQRVLNQEREEEERKLRLKLEFERQQQQQSSRSEPRREETQTAQPPRDTEQQRSQATVSDLYGTGKAYPEPYPAGRVPGTMVQERRKMRAEGRSFVYAIRYRSGPFGLTFDNRPASATVVEKVERGMQSELSDVQAGDVLIAIDQFNVSTAPAKATQRIMSNLPWPRILVFETRATKLNEQQLQQKKESLTYNLTILYPPSLLGTYEIRSADWTPAVSSIPSSNEECPLFVLRAPEDQFGCVVNDTEYALSKNVTDIIGQRGYVPLELEMLSPMVALMIQEGYKRDIKVKVRAMAVTRRGSCTFVEKAKIISSLNADMGILVNTDNALLDMPSGKEDTTNCSVPFASVSVGNGLLLHIAAMKQEVLGTITSSTGYGDTTNCVRMRTMSEDILNRWPHSKPHVPVNEVLNGSPPPSKLRSPTDEGGRLAVSGEDGWAFFDYHLAMFGEQDVPQVPMKIVMANPLYGCDPNNYLVRISGAIVAVLRGGGCSFGIKVLNAQKLGAKAVIIVNTDDKKTMRLMAQPDEVPLINITCIMVARRIQFYLEKQLQRYYLTDQHIALIQPTGIFGEYEQRNAVELPMRLPSR